ncbi:MAG: hypothetical protein R6U70_10645 [Bacillota bacterium]
MRLVRLWLWGYVNPSRFVDELRSLPAPHLGICAQLLRALLVSVLVYLPVSLMGRVPPTPSFVPFIADEHYFTALIFLAPVVLILGMLVFVSFLHVSLRLLGHPSDFDQLVNLAGMSDLVVGVILILWDWAWFAIGGIDQYVLGTSHLVISLWAVFLLVLGMKRSLDIPVPIGLVLNVCAVALSLPMAMLFMRSPF